MHKMILAALLALVTMGSHAAEVVAQGNWTTIDYDVEGGKNHFVHLYRSGYPRHHSVVTIMRVDRRRADSIARSGRCDEIVRSGGDDAAFPGGAVRADQFRERGAGSSGSHWAVAPQRSWVYCG